MNKLAAAQTSHILTATKLLLDRSTQAVKTISFQHDNTLQRRPCYLKKKKVLKLDLNEKQLADFKSRTFFGGRRIEMLLV